MKRRWQSLVSTLAIGSSLGLAWACVPQTAAPKRAETRAPQTFTEGSSGRSIGVIPWKEYFSDATLQGLIHHALEGSYDIPLALQRVEVARAYASAATGAQYPKVGFGVGAAMRKYGLYTMDGAGNAATDITPGRVVPTHLPDFFVGLQASWEPDFWGKLQSGKKAAVARYLASVEAVQSTIGIVVGEVASTYFELLAADAQVAVIAESLKQQRQALEIVHWQKLAGRSSELAVQQFQNQVTETESRHKLLAQHVLLTENRLNALLGRYPQNITRNKEQLYPNNLEQLDVGVPSNLLRNRPDLRAAELRLEASKYDVEVARAAFYPSLDIAASVGLQAFNPRYLIDVPQSIAYGLSGSLLTPLINRSAIEADFAGANALQLEALYEYQKTILMAYFDVANSLAKGATSRGILELKRKQTQTSELAVTTSDALYRAGKASYLEVLLAQQSRLDAQLQMVEAARAVRMAQVGTYLALGGGWR
jgi:outer membrane protein, multidrug efflux system